MKPVTFATVIGIQLQISQTGLLSSLVLWIVLALAANWLLPLTIGQAILGGLLATLLHWVNVFGHHLGHAAAARRVGYPLELVRMFYLLGGQRYPRNEPDLPAKTHIQRALGGPIANLCLALVGMMAVWLLRPFGELPFYLSLFFTLESFFIFFIGALLPLGFTDGSTLLYWWPKRRQSN
ncbi:MAG: hypothetical protein GY796_00805 [Chloroflexi bacterium]|nr:hypothetical protein [Chloroflexota bacterium]